MSQQPPWLPQQVPPSSSSGGAPPQAPYGQPPYGQPPYGQPQWGLEGPPSSPFAETQVWPPLPPQQPFPGTTPPPGQFQPQPDPQYRLPQSKQRSRRPWYKRRGVIIGLVCAVLIVVLLLGYGVATVLGNELASTPAATPTPSGQLTAASPTAIPTLAPTPAPTHKPKPTPTPKAKATPTQAPTPTPTPKPKPSTVKVIVNNAGFSPKTLTVPVGTTVIWTNDGGIPHTVTDNGVFDSGNLPIGATFKFTFTKRGTYHYICTYHPYMVGTIIVQ